MKPDDEIVVKRHFEGTYKMIKCKSYNKNKDIPDNKEILFMDSNIVNR